MTNMSLILSVVALPFIADALAGGPSARETIVSTIAYEYTHDCGTESKLNIRPGAVALSLQKHVTKNVPGAGIDSFTPFKTVLKDGFMQIDCVKDYMYYRGDKYGDHKYDYKLGPVSNVSIVPYDIFVEYQDQAPMTVNVCFEFCRTVPNMGFFGIVNGRGCYCTPYYKPMAGDSSQCTSPCEGDSSMTCGGQSKSSIFAMHMCASTKGDLRQWSNKALSLKSDIAAKVKTAKGLSQDMQKRAVVLQASFGAVGDRASADLMQTAKIFAGTLQHKADDANAVIVRLTTQITASNGLKDFSSPSTVTKADRLMDDIEETIAAAEVADDELDQVIAKASPAPEVLGAVKQYYPMMYFVDKAFDQMPSTCGGASVAEPIVGESKDGCASACDAENQDCVGFQYFGGSTKLCFLFSRLRTASYYTGCGKSFLQMSDMAPPFSATCYAKLATFEGTSLKPDPSGKTNFALKTLTKASRCFK